MNLWDTPADVPVGGWWQVSKAHCPGPSRATAGPAKPLRATP